MMKKNFMTLGFCAVLLLSSLTLFAQQENEVISFKVGSKVNTYPPVTWLKGEPILRFDSNKTYIIELWATWCGPCKAAIPHLNELHKKYGSQLTIVGQSVMENDLTKVKKFVKSKGDEMSYGVAYAGGTDSDFAKSWLEPAGINAIPRSFVIQNNEIVWMPHPEDLTEEAIQLLLEKKFSMEKLSEILKRQTKGEERVAAARHLIAEKKFNEAILLLDTVLTEQPQNHSAAAFKGKALEEAGCFQEAGAFFRQKNETVFAVDFLLQYYGFLQRQGMYGTFDSVVNRDVQRALDTDPALLPDVVALAYGVFIEGEEFDSLASFIRKITTNTTTADALITLASVGVYYKVPASADEVYRALLDATNKLFRIGQLDFYYLTPELEMFWMNGRQKEAKQLLKAAIRAGKRDRLPRGRMDAMQQLSKSLRQGNYPDAGEIERLTKLAAQ